MNIFLKKNDYNNPKKIFFKKGDKWCMSINNPLSTKEQNRINKKYKKWILVNLS